MRLPARSLGARTDLRLTVMKPWRKTREGKTGIATKGHCFAAMRVTTSDNDISEASKACAPAMRSKISRGESIARKSRSMPAGRVSPA